MSCPPAALLQGQGSRYPPPTRQFPRLFLEAGCPPPIPHPQPGVLAAAPVLRLGCPVCPPGLGARRPQPGIWPASWPRPPPGASSLQAPPRPASGRPSLPARSGEGLARRRRQQRPRHGRAGEPGGRLGGGGGGGGKRPGRAADAVSAAGRAGQASWDSSTPSPPLSPPVGLQPQAAPPLFLEDTPDRGGGGGGGLCSHPGKPHPRHARVFGQRGHTFACLWGPECPSTWCPGID